MPKGSSGKSGKIPAGRRINVVIKDEKRASSRVARALTDHKIAAVQAFPELKGTMYNELNKLTEAKFSKSSVLGFYQPGAKKITINERIVGDESQVRKTVAHELGHALTATTRSGFNSTTTAFNRAYKEYKETHPRATQKKFASTISSYAKTAKSEAFAEAFMDFTINGKNAAVASKLIIKHWRK